MLAQLYLLGEIVIAMILGGIIGIEREISDKPAGLRTHILVSGASALFVGLANLMVLQFSADQASFRTDPIRVIEAVVAGVSFLGAGTIFRRANAPSVEGLTTAASLLFSAGIGVCVSTHQYILAVGVTLLGLLILFCNRWILKFYGQAPENQHASS